jgi:hypothetical protein
MAIFKKKKVLLVYENTEEASIAEKKLVAKGYLVNKGKSISEAIDITRDFVPDLIVVNTSDAVQEIQNFNSGIEKRYPQKIDLLNLLDLENYLKVSVNEHVAIKPINPDLLYHLVRLIIKN